MTLDIPVDLRLSSLRMGTRANPRLVWSLGIHKSFLGMIPEEARKARIAHQSGKLLIQIGEQGVKLSEGVKGNFAYASSVGEHHLTGMTTASQEMTAQRLRGKFDPERNIIEVTDDLPAIVKASFLDIEAILEEAKPENHFPATHFQEDIEAAVLKEGVDLNNPTGASLWYKVMTERGQKEVHTVQTDLTPALAEVILNHNVGNRPVRPAKLSQYVSDIKEGRWNFNGETIIISKEGSVNNGQHRSLAVKETGIPIPALFVFGVERDSRRTVDTGANRGPRDHLSVDGYTQPTTLAALTRFVIAFERNDGQNFAYLNRVTASEIYERVHADPLLDEASQFPYRFGNKAKRLAPPSVMSFCYYVMSKVDRNATEAFLEQVITGIGLTAGSPAYVTREKLLEFTSFVREQKIEVLMRGFLAYQKRKSIRGIRVKWELPKL